MLVITLYYQDQKIEFFNMWLGKETIKVDGQTVSTKRSFLGAENKFVIYSEGREKSCRFNTGLGYGGIVYDFYVDGNTILESSKKSVIYSAMLIGLAIGVFISIYNGSGC